MCAAKAHLTVIDTDPGIDDAIGILLALASPEFSLCGLTIVAGNLGLDTTTRNAGRILAFAGQTNIPVLPGARKPLSGSVQEPLELHGGDGVGGVELPEPERPPAAQPATEWLVGLLLEQPPGTVDILALGPLTNLAHLIIDRPEAAQRIGRIIAMGARSPSRAMSGLEQSSTLRPIPRPLRLSSAHVCRSCSFHWT